MKFLALLLIGWLVISPSPAQASDYRECVTFGEASSLAQGQTRGTVRKLLDGPGNKQPDKVWWYSMCNKPSSTHRVIVWYKNGTLDGAVQFTITDGGSFE